ncbi:unnamed protein product, partial [Closterium sp. NIES-54]
MPFEFPDLGSFVTVSDLATHLRSLNTSYRATCTEARLLLTPPPMWLTVHWLVTRLPYRLSSAHDVLLQKHPSELTIDLFESTLSKIESNLLFVASATDALAPRLFEGNEARVSRKGGGGRGGGGGGAGSGSGGGEGGTGVPGGGDPGGKPGHAGSPGRVVAVSGGPGAQQQQSQQQQPQKQGQQQRQVLQQVHPWEPPQQWGPPQHWAPPQHVDFCLSSLGASIAALDACVATKPGAPPAEASLSFTLDLGVSQCFFRDHTTLTPFLPPFPVALADPASGPAVARSSTTLSCPVVPTGVHRGLIIPSFIRNL